VLLLLLVLVLVLLLVLLLVLVLVLVLLLLVVLALLLLLPVDGFAAPAPAVHWRRRARPPASRICNPHEQLHHSASAAALGMVAACRLPPGLPHATRTALLCTAVPRCAVAATGGCWCTCSVRRPLHATPAAWCYCVLLVEQGCATLIGCGGDWPHRLLECTPTHVCRYCCRARVLITGNCAWQARSHSTLHTAHNASDTDALAPAAPSPPSDLS
jgi:hypothetical protein